MWLVLSLYSNNMTSRTIEVLRIRHNIVTLIESTDRSWLGTDDIVIAVMPWPVSTNYVDRFVWCVSTYLTEFAEFFSMKYITSIIYNGPLWHSQHQCTCRKQRSHCLIPPNFFCTFLLTGRSTFNALTFMGKSG